MALVVIEKDGLVYSTKSHEAWENIYFPKLTFFFSCFSNARERTQSYNLLFFVFFLSVSVLQIRVDGSSLALQYETVQAVDNGPILRDMAFSSDYHYLYVMSETQVRCTKTHTRAYTHSIFSILDHLESGVK